jgi:hypothetical protein
MSTTMRKKIPLMINESYKAELENSAKVILEKIDLLKQKVNDFLNIEFDKTDALIEFIKVYQNENQIDNIEQQNELLYIKFDSEIAKLLSDYNNLIKTKALEMFCTDTDREKAKEIIHFAVSINKSIQKFNLPNLDLECFVLNDEFVYNSKIDTRIKELYTTYCQNDTQRQLKELAEKLSEIVKHSIRTGLIADNLLGTNIENIIDINTGHIKYNKIAVIQ